MTEPTEEQIAEADALLRQFADGNAAENLAAYLGDRDARLAEVEALIATLPRNEFGNQHYLAIEVAYANVVRQLRAALHPDPSET